MFESKKKQQVEKAMDKPQSLVLNLNTLPEVLLAMTIINRNINLSGEDVFIVPTNLYLQMSKYLVEYHSYFNQPTPMNVGEK